MDPRQNLYYSLGQLAYAVARSDNAVQKEEKQMLHRILEKEFRNQGGDTDYSEIIFHILEKDKMSVETAFGWAMDEIKMNKTSFDKQMQGKFIVVLDNVAESFPPVTEKESKLIEKFKKELVQLSEF